jgi:hypothetical protein
MARSREKFNLLFLFWSIMDAASPEGSTKGNFWHLLLLILDISVFQLQAFMSTIYTGKIEDTAVLLRTGSPNWLTCCSVLN